MHVTNNCYTDTVLNIMVRIQKLSNRFGIMSDAKSLGQTFG